jgi:IS605 OrfB family transposase
MPFQTKTLSVRVRNKHARLLRQMAFEVNQVWNLANEISDEAGRIPVPEVGWTYGYSKSAFDIQKELAGIQRQRQWAIGSSTVQETIAVHAKARKQFKRNKLRWRVSGGPRRSLGFVPFKARAAVWHNGQVQFAGHLFKVWDSYGLSQYQFRAGSFSEDARGRWYFNVAVRVEETRQCGTSAVGIDLGLKDVATTSGGDRLENQKIYQSLEQKLGIAQRARKKRRVRAIHAKIRNRRKDALHQFSNRIVKNHGAIFVGNVSSSKLAKTKMAKSVLDAGWAMLKTQLEYKAIRRSAVFVEVDESYSTQVCSCCGCLPDSSPKGRADLGIREWTCSGCGAEHDRDINAARNILAAGHRRLAEGISAV